MPSISPWRILLMASFVLIRASTLPAADRGASLTSATYSIHDEPALPCDATHEATSLGTQRRAANAFCRAGHPECVRRRAVPSNQRHDVGYYVGGGLPVLGEKRCVLHEGTWGWDYGGILFPKKIALNWGHGVWHQGGAGAHKTDGPKLRHE